ncbi:zinc finger domain-containing protein [Streptomyces antimycoticus]
MPDSIRHVLRAQQHPARSVPCPHCGAKEHRPCMSRSKTRQLSQPHPGRISAWARSTAVCPACQVELDVPCHDGGRALHDGAVHPEREAIAGEVAA